MHSIATKDSDVFAPCPLRGKIVSRRVLWIAVVSLVFWQSGCGNGTTKPPSSSRTANISISPGSATVGGPDLTLTVTGSQNFTFSDGDHKFTRVVWSSSTPLATTFISSSELTAIVPASLLASALSTTLHVEVWDDQGDAPLATSSLVPFQVTSSSTSNPIPIPSISSISPSTVAAGSPDVTITIDGSNFGHFRHFVWSTVFWTTNGNLHDTGIWLKTTIIGSNQLTAVIPAALLESPTSVEIVVMNGDIMSMSDGYFGYPESNAVRFTVTP